MIERVIGLLILLSPLSSFPVAADTPAKDVKDYLAQRTKEVTQAHIIAEGNFAYSFFPSTPEFDILGSYPTWSEDGYTQAKMVKLAANIYREAKSINVYLIFHFIGPYNAKGKDNLSVPADIKSLVQLTNDLGTSVPCGAAKFLSISHNANWYDKNVVIQLAFPFATHSGTSILKGASYVEFHLSGLGFRDTTVRYDLPLASMFLDMPKEVRVVVNAARREVK